MKIILSDNVALKLMTAAHATANEFSGFGFVQPKENDLLVYDAVILNVGNYSYTEIPPAEIEKLMNRPDRASMKLWFHRHPIGNGIPGKHNWSSTDETTIHERPLGGIPELVQWSVSIVLTPGGWVGRIDNYLTGKTAHVPVYPQFPEVYQQIHELRKQSVADLPSPGDQYAYLLDTDDVFWDVLDYQALIERKYTHAQLRDIGTSVEELAYLISVYENQTCADLDSILDINLDVDDGLCQIIDFLEEIRENEFIHLEETNE